MGDYRQSFDGFEAQTKREALREIYVQVSIYLPRYYLEHRFLTKGGRIGSTFNHPKLLVIQEPDQSFDIGELVVTRYRGGRSITLYRLRQGTGQAEHFKQRSKNRWNADGWTTVEVYANLDTQIVRLWTAHTGERPVLEVESRNADLGSGRTPTGDEYSGIQLVPRINNLLGDPSRNPTFVLYDELIVSTEPIPFPGGFAINGAK